MPRTNDTKGMFFDFPLPANILQPINEMINEIV